MIVAVWSFIILLQQQGVIANTTQDQNLNRTSTLNNSTQNYVAQAKLGNLRRQGHVKDAVIGEATRFTMPSTTTKKYYRSTPRRVSFTEDCDYLAHYCLKAYDTGVLCGRTLYYKYYTFKNYCLLDYVNCMERYEVWQVVHMGECFIVKELTEYILYPYDDDYFLDQYYIVEDN